MMTSETLDGKVVITGGMSNRPRQGQAIRGRGRVFTHHQTPQAELDVVVKGVLFTVKGTSAGARWKLDHPERLHRRQ
jgi:hypothetical protein